MHYDIIIIGAGLVGLSAALRIKQQKPSARVLVIEKEKGVAHHQSGHNSGVIHSGIYYKPGSKKAANCLHGAQLLKDYCAQKNIPTQIVGKLIIAKQVDELPRLEELLRRGIANGVACLRLLKSEEIPEIEPLAVGVAAIHCPTTGIIDYKQVAAAYLEDFLLIGGEVRFQERVTAIAEKKNEIIVRTHKQEFTCHRLVAAAGLQSDRIARHNTAISHKIIPFRGEYYELRPEKCPLVRGLIYPVPDPRFPFLGVHLSRMINGHVEAGPNAVLAAAREGYRKRTLHPKDISSYLSYPGFWRMAGKYWKTGLWEMWRSFSKASFVASIQELTPSLTEKDFIPGGCGIRAQVVQRSGQLEDDFLFSESPRSIHVLNAPSPAATSSLAIGQTIADLLSVK